MSTGRGSAELGVMCGERPVLDLGKGADQGRLVAQSTHLLCFTWAHGARLGKQVREAVARPRGDEAGELGQGRETGEGEGAVALGHWQYRRTVAAFCLVIVMVETSFSLNVKT